MKLIVISGMSGAGKAVAARTFEDMGYTVVDNLPPILLPDYVDKVREICRPPEDRLAAVVDSRAGIFFAGWGPAFDILRARDVRPILLFFDATDAVLVQRFKETRRKHPLFDSHGGILGSIQAERSLLEGMREAADKVVDTSDLDVNALRTLLTEEFATASDPTGLTITVASFGFKHGLPLDADLVFDVRFLVNPHYVPKLRALDGRDKRIEEYVAKDPQTDLFLHRLYDLIDFSIPQYIREGKAYLTIAIGCTGGRHRSVVVGEKLADHLKEQGYRVLTQHRDTEK